DKTIILTDHTKWSCTSLSLFARFDQVDTLITDDGLNVASVAETRKLVKELVLTHQTGLAQDEQ
ncbi:DeoR/GlpR transcriptional regulator, partial [Bacillus subtilis]|nr:DeoR/GlpR transcriptional regulator [Bacillus subtilis]